MDPETEADRLLALDEAGRERELLVIALRLGQQAEKNWADLRDMDAEFLNGITNNRGGDEGSSPRPESIPEHLEP